MDEHAIGLALEFTKAIGRNSYEWARVKLSQAKEIKTIEEQQLAYEEIINTLLKEKMELEKLAIEYKNLYEKVTISDEDIEHLQKTIHHLVKLLSSTIPRSKMSMKIV